VDLELDDRRLSLLNPQNIRNIVLQGYEVFEIIQKVLFRDKWGKNTNRVNISACEVHPEPVRSEYQNFGLLAF